MTARFIVADVMDGLATLETGSVDLVITSPPFLALRSYLPADHPDKGKEIGSEATPAEFIDVMLKVTAELRRVLAPHGSICIELGDTYAGGGAVDNRADENGLIRRKPYEDQPTFNRGSGAGSPTIGPGWPLSKSRTLIPSLYEIALAYGINPLTGQESPAGQWRIRNIITWARPNPPVGALGDKWRPATSDLIVACTSSKRYWDDLATRKAYAPGTIANSELVGYRRAMWREGRKANDAPLAEEDFRMTQAGAPLLDYWEIPLLEDDEPQRYGPTPPKPKGMSRHREGEPPRTDLPSQQRDGNWRTLPQTNDDPDGPGAPLLDYWVIPPGGYQGAHYAVFPQELVVPCVQAMAPPKVCRTCGQPSRRIVETSYEAHSPDTITQQNAEPRAVADVGSMRQKGNYDPAPQGMKLGRASRMDTTLGWSDCGHDNYRPALILDCFAGSGTTLAVATGFGHDAIGIDIDERNRELARDRVGPFLFETVEVTP